MTCRERLEQFLHDHGVAYELSGHREAYSAQDVAAEEHVSGYEFAKVVIAFVDEKMVMLVLPAPSRVNLEKLKQVLGASGARLAHEEEFVGVFSDCEAGAMPPFGNLYGTPVYLDAGLARFPRIVFNAGTHRQTMRIAFDDFERLTQPHVADFSTSPRPA
jgi:Ala-tRNA(Pro) deacylase